MLQTTGARTKKYSNHLYRLLNYGFETDASCIIDSMAVQEMQKQINYILSFVDKQTTSSDAMDAARPNIAPPRWSDGLRVFMVCTCAISSVVTDVAGDQVSESHESTGGDCRAPHCSA